MKNRFGFVLVFLSLSVAKAEYRSTLNCAGPLDGHIVSVSAQPLAGYHDKNLTIAVDGVSFVYNGRVNNEIIDSLQSIADFESGAFFVAAESVTDRPLATTLYGIPKTFQFKKSDWGMITDANFDAILRGHDPRLTNKMMSRDFMNEGGMVKLKCEFHAED